jgi:hypothetical protein
VRVIHLCRAVFSSATIQGALGGALTLTYATSALADPADAAVQAEAEPRPIASFSGSVPALADSLQPDARKEYDAARLLFQDGDYRGASAKFHLAFQLSGDPRLLWNQAVCEKEQRHYARATTLIERYLKEGANFLDAEKRRDAESLVEALRQFSSPVELKGVPAGATIEVDGELIGKTPLTSTLHLDLGRHTVRVEAVGFRPYVQAIEVPGAVPVRVPVKLAPEFTPTELSITVQPKNATIRIDGVVVGEGSFSGPIAPGVHDIRISASGRTSTERKLEVKKGQRQTLDVQLEKARSGKVWPWLVAGALVVAGGVTAGAVWASNGNVTGPQGSLGGVDASQR